MDFYDKRDDPFDFDDSNENFTELSNIQKFYDGCNIFITGGSGFIGSLLVEKLLRSCNVNKIYLLLRTKKGVTPVERLNKIFFSEIFDGLKRKNVDVMAKVELIPGDCGLPMCGMSEESMKILIEQVDVVFHAAACLRMNEHLHVAYNMNVRATRDLLSIASQMKRLKSFIYVSTAYSHSHRTNLAENFYPPGLTELEFRQLIEKLDDTQIAGLSPKVLGPWENTYAFTKAIAENLVKSQVGKIPIGVVRPSIVVGCLREPLNNWINNVYGASGVVAAASPGLIRTWYGGKDNLAEIIPADIVVNGTLAAGWGIHERWKENNPDNHQDPIYNIVSSPKNFISWGEYMNKAAKPAVGNGMASVKVMGEYWFGLQPNRMKYFMEMYLWHLVPAVIVDLILKIIGKKPLMLFAYRRIHKFNMQVGFYVVTEWVFEQPNFDDLWSKLSPQDKKLFNFDAGDFTWSQFLSHTVKGIRVYIFRDPMDTLGEARKRYLRLRNLRILAMWILIGLGLYQLDSYLKQLTVGPTFS